MLQRARAMLLILSAELAVAALNCTCPPNATTGAPVPRKACGNAGHGTQNTYCPSNPAPHQCNPGGCNPPPPIVPEFEKLECKLHQLAFEFGSTKVPTSPQALHDALMLGSSCAAYADVDANARVVASPPPPRGELPDTAAGRTLYVATTGSDSTGTGTQSAPFATLHAAAAAARKSPSIDGATTVLVRAGKYYFSETLVLGAADSGVRWAAYQGEQVTLSGGKRLQLQWQKYKGEIVKASVNPREGLLSLAEMDYLANAPTPPSPSPPHEWGSPPAKWNTLHVNGVRQVRARYPNGNPQDQSGICFSKANHPGENCSGYLAARGQEGGSLPGGTPGATVAYGLNRGNSPTKGCKQCGTFGTFKYQIFDPPAGHPTYNKPMPSLGWKNNSLFSFWGSPFSRPAGVQYSDSDVVPQLVKPSGAVVHMFHGGLWGGWQYQVTAQTQSAFQFGYGGYQEARGSGISNGKNHYYVESDLALLDVPGEWYYDKVAGELYFWPNGTDATSAEVVAPLLDTIIRIDGADDVSISGFHFTETRATYLEQYEVPSGGDWSVHRGASVVVEDSTRVNITACVWNQTGGNALLFSNNVTDSEVTQSEFVHIGDSAILSIGTTDRIFGTAPTYPNRLLIAKNHIREIGVYGKQTSCYFQALAANVTLRDNICYNGPRAGKGWRCFCTVFPAQTLSY